MLVWGEGFDFARIPHGARIIFLNAYTQPENGHADVFIPVSIQTERRGHYTNFQGVVSAFEPCFPKKAIGSRRRDAVRRVGNIRSRAQHDPGSRRHVLFIGYAVTVLLVFGTVLTWVERKQAAIMSDRIGANRAYVRIPFTQIKLVWLGLFHGLADGLKMMLKEDFKPNSYDRFAYAIAPWVVFTPVLLVFAVIPFGGTLVPASFFTAYRRWPPGSATGPIRCRSRASMRACWSSSRSAG